MEDMGNERDGVPDPPVDQLNTSTSAMSSRCTRMLLSESATRIYI